MNDLTQERKEISTLTETVSFFTIESPNDVKAGTVLLERVKDAKKALLEKKETMTRPAMDTLSSIRDFFRVPEESLAKVEKTLKAELLKWELSTRIPEEGTIAIEASIGPKTRTLTKVRIVDETKVPRKYLMPNIPVITEAVIRAGLKVPGVKLVKETIVVA